MAAEERPDLSHVTDGGQTPIYRSEVSIETELMIELCALYRRIVLRENELAWALQRIRELEGRQVDNDEGRANRQQQGTREVEGRELDDQIRANGPRSIPSSIQPPPETEEEPPMFEVFISKPPAQKKREPRFIDINVASHSSPSSTSLKPPRSKPSISADATTPGKPDAPADRRAIAASLLTAKSPGLPPPPPPSALRQASRPPFIPASREGAASTFNIHSIRQRRERERVLEEPTRIRHRPVVQQPPRDHR